jgi:hypothetical protein
LQSGFGFETLNISTIVDPILHTRHPQFFASWILWMGDDENIYLTLIHSSKYFAWRENSATPIAMDYRNPQTD